MRLTTPVPGGCPLRSRCKCPPPPAFRDRTGAFPQGSRWGRTADIARGLCWMTCWRLTVAAPVNRSFPLPSYPPSLRYLCVKLNQSVRGQNHATSPGRPTKDVVVTFYICHVKARRVHPVTSTGHSWLRLRPTTDAHISRIDHRPG